MKLISLIIVVLFTLSVAAEELTPASSETGETAFAYLITSADSEYVTTLHILNRSTEALSVTATLYDSNGDQLGLTAALNESIQGLGRISLGAADLEQLLGAPAWRGPALLKVEGSAVFELMTTLDNPTGLTTSTNCATTESVHHVLPGISYIRFINQGEKTISNIRGRLVTENGELIGLEELQLIDDLPPKAAQFLRADQILNLFGSWSGVASLHINDIESNDLRLLALDWQDRNFINLSCNQRSQKTSAPISCSEPRPQACIQVSDPVCAARDTGIRCVTTPCDSTEWATYANGCSSCADPLVFRYVKGSCESLLEG